MPEDRGGLSRKLAVIVHADVAGSTRLANQRIGDAFNRFTKIIERYGGDVHEVCGFTKRSRSACRSRSGASGRRKSRVSTISCWSTTSA